MLDQDEDLGRISRSHPDQLRHQLYDANAEFPADISGLLPPIADRWWEQLGKPKLLRFPHRSAYNL